MACKPQLNQRRSKTVLDQSRRGDRFSEIELEIGAYFTFVTDQPDPVVAMFAQNFGLPEDEMRKHPHALFGDVPTICEELERRRESLRNLLHHGGRGQY